MGFAMYGKVNYVDLRVAQDCRDDFTVDIFTCLRTIGPKIIVGI